MISTGTTTFYQRFLAARNDFEPRDFDINMARDLFIGKMAEFFCGVYRDTWTIHELLLHPAEAMRFCSDVRRHLSAFDLPDDIILRSILACD